MTGTVPLRLLSDTAVVRFVPDMPSLRCEHCGKLTPDPTPPEPERLAWEAYVVVMLALQHHGRVPDADERPEPRLHVEVATYRHRLRDLVAGGTWLPACHFSGSAAARLVALSEQFVAAAPITGARVRDDPRLNPGPTRQLPDPLASAAALLAASRQERECLARPLLTAAVQGAFMVTER